MQSISEDQLINIGFISKPYGFNGELIFAIEEGDADDYEHATFFFITMEGKPVPFLVEAIKTNGSSMIVKLQDVSTESEAKKLSGKKISVEKSSVASPVNDMDWDDLIGYHLFDKTYGLLGRLERLEKSSHQIIAQCTVNNKEVLFPLHEDFIAAIDEEKKELHLDLPEGLLDVYLK